MQTQRDAAALNKISSIILDAADYIIDLLVEEEIIIELKSIEANTSGS